MKMQIIDYMNKIIDLKNEKQLIEILNINNDQQKNQFWLSQKIDSCGVTQAPKLAVILREDLAVIHYISSCENYVSKGNIERLNVDEFTEFLIEKDPHHPLPNYQIVSFSDAIKVCIEFFRQPEVLPYSIEWEEL